jgi:hypothetical protein
MVGGIIMVGGCVEENANETGRQRASVGSLTLFIFTSLSRKLTGVLRKLQ